MADIAANLSSAIRLQKAGVLSDAAVLYGEVLAEDPSHIAALTNLGVLLAAQGNLEDAAENYRRVLELAPGDADTLNNLGRVYHAQDKTSDAEASFREALTYHPAHPVANANLGRLLAETGRTDDAIVSLRQAFDMDREDAAIGINLGALLVQQGREPEAEEVLRETVRRQPSDPAACGALGDFFANTGSPAEAEKCYRAQVDLEPDSALAWYRLGTVLVMAGKQSDALRAHQRAAHFDPDMAPAWREAGNLMLLQGRLDEAKKILETALKADPVDGKTHMHLGALWYGQNLNEQALEHFQRAKESQPGLFEAHYNAALCLHRLDRPEETLRALRSVAKTFPDQALGHMALAALYQTKGQIEDAVESGERAVRLDPGNPEILLGVAKAKLAQGENASALEYADRALENGDAAEFHTVRAQILAQMRNYRDALAAVSDAMAAPGIDSADTLLTLARVCDFCQRIEESLRLYQMVLVVSPDNAEALSKSLQFKLTLCDWSEYDEFSEATISRVKDAVENKTELMYCVQDLHNFPVPAGILARASKHQGDRISAEVQASGGLSIFDHQNKLDRWRQGERWRLRVGYALPYTWLHSFPMMMKGLIDQRDRDKFETFGYSIRPSSETDFDDLYRGTFDHFRDFPENDPGAAGRLIYGDDIDILIDVTGHSEIHCQELMATRAAPVQVEAMGFSLTVGGGYIDYLLTQGDFLSQEFVQHCDEVLVYMPDSLFSAYRPPIADKDFPRVQLDLPEDGFVFANFNQPFKFDPIMFSVWMRILKRVEGSVLWLGSWREEIRANLRREAEARGVDGDRLVFGMIAQHDDHMARLRQAGLLLDNRLHGGGASTMDGLWAGVPLVTCPAQTPVSRNGCMLANALGIPEMVADSLDAYEELAVALAADPERHRALCDKVRKHAPTHPLFDQKRFAQHLESAIDLMWERSVFRGAGPITVPRLDDAAGVRS